MMHTDHNTLAKAKRIMLRYLVPPENPDIHEVQMPRGAVVRSAAAVWRDEHNDYCCEIWAQVSTLEDAQETVRFYLVETANPMDDEVPEDAIFLNTVVYYMGQHIRHVFYKKLD